jgi:glutamine synthetase
MVNSASKASWGYEDRDACVRIPESDERNLRLEFRLPGADANPYLVLAALLCSIEQGLEARREPIAPLNDDRESGIDFPTDMLEAVRQMRASPAVNAGLGEEFVMVYCENKRQDHLAFLHDINPREYRWYL